METNAPTTVAEDETRRQDRRKWTFTEHRTLSKNTYLLTSPGTGGGRRWQTPLNFNELKSSIKFEKTLYADVFNEFNEFNDHG